MHINEITDIALNVNCSTTKVKPYLIWLSETCGRSFHKAALCTLKGLLRRITCTEELKFHIHEAKYTLFRTSFSCVKRTLLRDAVALERSIC